jgi:hypothetical protein
MAAMILQWINDLYFLIDRRFIELHARLNGTWPLQHHYASANAWPLADGEFWTDGWGEVHRWIDW